MKALLFFIFFLFTFPSDSTAQDLAAKSHPKIRHFSNDSVNIYYNEKYLLTEDSCADIIRQGHYNIRIGKFTGPFKDVSKLNPKHLLAKGNYTTEGLKEGEFVIYYSNGNLQARGNYKNDHFADTWDLYYPSGKPRLTFETGGGDLKIINAWDEDGSKRVVNEKGSYDLVIGPITWKGKIENGKPDGKWTARRTAFKQEEVLATEHFKKGMFQQGSNGMGVYKNNSNINILQNIYIPITTAENLISAASCNNDAEGRKSSAYYPKGDKQFLNDVGERLTPVLNHLNLRHFYETLELQCIILDDGRIKIDPTNGMDPRIASAYGQALQAMPKFVPAKINDYPVQQKIVISIKYNMSVYQFGFKMLPV